jgi:hypothetical protein
MLGVGEGRATGVVAGRLQASPLERGVFHAEQHFDPLEVFAGVKEHGIDLGDHTLEAVISSQWRSARGGGSAGGMPPTLQGYPNTA